MKSASADHLSKIEKKNDKHIKNSVFNYGSLTTCSNFKALKKKLQDRIKTK